MLANLRLPTGLLQGILLSAFLSLTLCDPIASRQQSANVTFTTKKAELENILAAVYEITTPGGISGSTTARKQAISELAREILKIGASGKNKPNMVKTNNKNNQQNDLTPLLGKL